MSAAAELPGQPEPQQPAQRAPRPLIKIPFKIPFTLGAPEDPPEPADRDGAPVAAGEATCQPR